MSSTHVGMNRNGPRLAIAVFDEPHARGDEPNRSILYTPNQQ